MKAQNPIGKIYFLKTDKNHFSSQTSFGTLLEINTNFTTLTSIHINNNEALGLTSNNELLQWENDKKQSQKKNKNPYNFLQLKPSYHFNKIKFKNICLNKTMCLGLDINGNVLVWGNNNDGLLGLGYEITNVETPTILEELKEIINISISDFHAVVINNYGNAFSWGLGKYGELGLEKSIYSSVPQQIITETFYTKVYCSNLITCFLDNNGKFYYFGVIIKQLGGFGSSLTIKSLLNDDIYHNGKIIFLEKQIEELEHEKFKDIIIGNGFIALLTNTGCLFSLEYNDKLTMLYSKYFLYNIAVAQNEIYGLAKSQQKENLNSKLNDFYLFHWVSKSSSDNELSTDSWTTTIWKFKENFQLINNGDFPI